MTPKPRPPVPSPAVIAQHHTHPVKVPVVEFSAAQLEAAAAHGEIVGDVVRVKDGADWRDVGPANGAEPLIPYAKAYLELTTSVEQFHARLVAGTLSVSAIESGMDHLRQEFDAPAVVGDLDVARTRLEEVLAQADSHLESLRAERESARAEALAAREQLVAHAEELAAKPEGSIHWKNDTAAMRDLVDAWKEAQRTSVRIPKDQEKALWKRLTHARTRFEKVRKHHFAQLDRANAEVKERKETLVARAVALSSSTDWDATAREFKSLMDEWKSAGRGRRSVDDALWKQFSQAQEAFFDARRQAAQAHDESLAGNVDAKQGIVQDAEALLPITDVNAAKQALRSLQDRFEAAGDVPRADAARLNKRLAAVERAVREADQAQWTSRNPEIEARATGAAAQLKAAIADLDEQIAAATTAGDDARVASLTESRQAREAWLAQVEDVL